MKKALITGVNGFMGSWLAEYLLEKNFSVAATVLNKKYQQYRADKR